MTDISASWSSQLEKITQHLAETRTNIQDAFLEYSKESQSQAKSNHGIIPLEPGADPVSLLTRISLLESTLESLRQDCEDFVRQRPIVLQEVTQLMLENFKSIEELTVLAKGRKASIDPNMKRLALSVHEQHEAWKCCSPSRNLTSASETDAPMSDQRAQLMSSNHGDNLSNKHNPQDTTDKEELATLNSSPIVSLSRGEVIISPDKFQSIPLEKRGRSTLARAQNVASMIYEETSARYREGYRGKSLAVERSNLYKYAPAFPEMNTVLRDHALWRDIISSLEYLGLVKVNHSDGSLFWILSHLNNR